MPLLNAVYFDVFVHNCIDVKYATPQRLCDDCHQDLQCIQKEKQVPARRKPLRIMTVEAE